MTRLVPTWNETHIYNLPVYIYIYIRRTWKYCVITVRLKGLHLTKGWRLDRGYRPKKTGETVDCRQNNGSVKAVSPRHCPATSALRNCCFNTVLGQGHKDNVRSLHCCWGTTRSERSPTFAAQLHLPNHYLFWANLKVQLHIPPLDLDLDLLISPGTLDQRRHCLWHLRSPAVCGVQSVSVPSPRKLTCTAGDDLIRWQRTSCWAELYPL